MQKLIAMLVLAAERANNSKSQNKGLTMSNQRSPLVSHPISQKAKWASLDLQ